MFIGYARTSTVEQVAGLEAQQHQLAATGCTKLFAEQASSVGQRDQLDAALGFAREGDTLVVARLDRLARPTTDCDSTAQRCGNWAIWTAARWAAG